MHSITNRPAKIFLIGFMGTGKTYWGKVWSEAMGIPFYDLDKLIEAAEQDSIANIFEKKGEAYFRQVEMEQLRKMQAVPFGIIACGGGTPCYADNMEWMKFNGITIYIQSTAADILKRVLTEKAERPLLKNLNKAELLFFIEQKLKERLPYYTTADHILDSTLIDKDSLQILLAQ